MHFVADSRQKSPYAGEVHGALAWDIQKERPMRLSIVIEIWIWKWRLRLKLSRR
jgi:hypothetical protein